MEKQTIKDLGKHTFPCILANTLKKFGNNKALGTLFAGLLFGMLQAAQPIMQGNKIPKEITFIIQGLVVVFISLKAGITIFLAWKERRKVEKAEKLEKAALAGGAK